MLTNKILEKIYKIAVKMEAENKLNTFASVEIFNVLADLEQNKIKFEKVTAILFNEFPVFAAERSVFDYLGAYVVETNKAKNKAAEAVTEEVVAEEKKAVKIIDKIKELFGENFVIKSKKVKELVQLEMADYEECEHGHLFNTGKNYTADGASLPLVLTASQMKNGKFWIKG